MTTIDRWLRSAFVAGLIACGLVASPLARAAEQASGILVWVDERNAALLLECAEGGCGKIPSAKTGETYTFVIPPGLKSAVGNLKEGQKITVVYDTRADGAYVMVSVQ